MRGGGGWVERGDGWSEFAGSGRLVPYVVLDHLPEVCWTNKLPNPCTMPQLTRWYWGGLARAYAASSALQQTRLGVTRAAWEKLNMEARPGGGKWAAGRAGVWWQEGQAGGGSSGDISKRLMLSIQARCCTADGRRQLKQLKPSSSLSGSPSPSPAGWPSAPASSG